MSAMLPHCPCCAAPAGERPTGSRYIRCSRCGHRWRAAPADGAATRYEALVERNDPDTRWFRRKIADRVAALSSLMNSGVARILEVGCAEGELGRQTKALFPVIYDGIELSRDSERAKTGLDRVFQTPAAQVQSAAYDLIVSFHVLEHIAQPGLELEAWSKLLSAEGRLLIEVPNQAGHPLLDSDRNPEHLHQFTPASLAVLLAAHGFVCREMSLGHYESPVYPDSIRLIAQRQPLASRQRARLLECFHRKIGGPFVAYGAGGDFENYVRPLSDALDIRALVDSSPEKWGTRIDHLVVTAYDPELHRDLPVLTCSLKFGANIRQHLLSIGIAGTRIIGLEDIYEPA